MSTIAPDRPLLTVREAAARLRVSEKTVRRLIGAEILPALRIGGSIRVDPDELQAWLYGDVSGDGSRQGQLRADAEDPAERRETSIPARQSSSRAHAGAER
jgi:excisionase family DNA binding protein